MKSKFRFYIATLSKIDFFHMNYKHTIMRVPVCIVIGGMALLIRFKKKN